jgi:hypothetical protein
MSTVVPDEPRPMSLALHLDTHNTMSKPLSDPKGWGLPHGEIRVVEAEVVSWNRHTMANLLACSFLALVVKCRPYGCGLAQWRLGRGW